MSQADDQLYDIKAVYQTLREDETNAYLALGWRLLKILVKDDEGEYVGYVLGWPSSEPAPRPSYDPKTHQFSTTPIA